MRRKKYVLSKKKKINSKVINWIKRILILLFALGASFYTITVVFIQSYTINTQAMNPTFTENETVLASPLSYGIQLLPETSRILRFSDPVPGDVVISVPGNFPETGIFTYALEGIVRFFTFQKISLFHNLYPAYFNQLQIKRVIAGPGETVYMEDFVFYIQDSPGMEFISEFERSPRPYRTQHPALPENWSADLPVSGDLPPVQLGENEYFLASDNRTANQDSRNYGAVAIDRIRSKVVLVYWPASSIRTP
ncbi:MAG: signal peptidase I [Spirochaetia bacterium]